MYSTSPAPDKLRVPFCAGQLLRRTVRLDPPRVLPVWSIRTPGGLWWLRWTVPAKP